MATDTSPLASDSTISKPVILVVDDTPDNLTLMSGLLRDRYRVKVANSGAKALQLVKAQLL